MGKTAILGGTRLDISGNAVGNGLIWALNIPELFAQREAHTGARGSLRFGGIPLQAAWLLLYSLVLSAALGQHTTSGATRGGSAWMFFGFYTKQDFEAGNLLGQIFWLFLPVFK